MMQNDGPPRKKSGTPSWEVPVFVRSPRVLRCLLTAIHLYPRHNNVPAYRSDWFRTSSLNVCWEDAEKYWRSGLPARGKLFVEERSGHVDGQVGDSPLRAGVHRPSTSSAVCVLRRGDSVSRLTSL